MTKHCFLTQFIIVHEPQLEYETVSFNIFYVRPILELLGGTKLGGQTTKEI